MAHYVILGSWSDCVGTDYCDYLGEYDTKEEAMKDAKDYAWNIWEPQEEDDEYALENGPDYSVEIYDPAIHDDQRAGGGSFQFDIDR